MKGLRIATFLTLSLIFSASLILSACSGIYETNTFAALEVGASETDISGMLRESRLDQLTAVLQEASTYDDLSPTEAAEIELFLSGLLSDSADPRVQGAAAESLSALTVYTTSVGSAVHALVDGLAVLIPEGDEGTAPSSLLQTLVPAEATDSESAFNEFVATLYELRSTHEVVNTALQDPRVDLTAPGNLVQAAFVTYLLTATINAIDPNGDGIADEPREVKASVLYTALSGGGGSLGLLDPPLAEFAVETVLTDAADPGSGIDVILASTGFASLVAGLVPELGTTSDGG